MKGMQKSIHLWKVLWFTVGRKIEYDLASFHCTFVMVHFVIKAFWNISYISPKGTDFCRVFYEEAGITGFSSRSCWTFLGKNKMFSLGCSSVREHMLNMRKSLGSVPSTTKKRWGTSNPPKHTKEFSFQDGEFQRWLILWVLYILIMFQTNQKQLQEQNEKSTTIISPLVPGFHQIKVSFLKYL